MTKILISSLLFLSVLQFYLYFACPDIFWGDSADLATASDGLMIAHVTGYPLFVTLAKTAHFLPFGNIAYKTTLFCVCLSSMTLIVLLFLITGITHQLPAFLAVIIMMFNPLLMISSVKTEVYSLNALIFAFALVVIHKLTETDFI